MKIAMITSEANPFIKTGGLADVTYALSKELVALGEEVALFMPLYLPLRSKIFKKLKKACQIDVHMSWRHANTTVYKLLQDGITYYFVENQQYFERDAIYGYADDGERFAFFDNAVYEALIALKFKPDIIHVHDWQSAIFPCLCKERGDKFFKNTKYVLTIHNPAFLGILDPYALGNLFELNDECYKNGKAEFKGVVSTLKCGITYADKIVAVSPNHRYELLTVESGMGLHDVLGSRKDDFLGILNGIDCIEFNPSEDVYFIEHYDIEDYRVKKDLLKKDICKAYGLKIKDKPLFSMVSRLTWQKGLDILVPTIEELAKQGNGIFIVGSGEKMYEDALQTLHDKYPDKVAVYIGYSNELAHKVYAASDFFLMPSLFEPCGLGQMIAERYGSLPIVRRVGGLKDSVIGYDNYNPETANGFGFDDYYKEALLNTCLYACDVYKDKKLFERLVQNAINTDNSW